jgi:hypothetical protein
MQARAGEPRRRDGRAGRAEPRTSEPGRPPVLIFLPSVGVLIPIVAIALVIRAAGGNFVSSSFTITRNCCVHKTEISAMSEKIVILESFVSILFHEPGE